MELLPAILPPTRHGLTRSLRKGRPDLRLASAAGVDNELDRGARVVLLEPCRKAFDEPGASDLGLVDRDAERDADETGQRNALFRRLKNPSSSSRET